MGKNRFGGLLVVLLLCLAVPCQAGITGNHYTNGAEGIKGASVPPPGNYYRLYNVFYSSDELMDTDGDKLDVDFDVFVFANVHRFIHVSEWKILGGNFFGSLLVPVVYTDLEIGALGVEDDDWSIGDSFIEPAGLAWHGERWDAAVSLGVWVPTGPNNDRRPAYPGKDYWTGMLTFGATVYPDAAKTWSVSWLGRYEVHSEKQGDDLTAGDDFHFEWGIGKALPPSWKLGPLQAWEVGVVGYAQWQVTDDRGDDVTWDKDDHDRVFAVGPEVRCMIPQWKLLLELRSQQEFGAVDRSEGLTTTLVVTKIF
ncbi:MAG: transporter [Syntrophotaleaceae bacterium]